MMFETFSQDVHYTLRSMKQNPLLVIATVLTLATGIGLNVSVFTFIDGVLFRARVEKDPASFVHLSPAYKSRTPSHQAPWAVSVRDYQAYQAGAQAVRALAAWTNVRMTLGKENDSTLGLLVTCNFFDVYGLEQPKMGRLFASNECAVPGAAAVAVISEELWRNRFDADPQVIGGSIVVNRVPFSIIGVLPAGFSGRLRGPGIWVPWTMQPMFFKGQDFFHNDAVRWLTAEGRLKPGHSKAEVQSELGVIAARQDRLDPDRQTEMTITNGSFAEEPSLRGSLFWIGPLVMGALTLILMMACTNVTVLQLSRAVTRQKEMGIRLSLGASRWRLMRMLLTESLLLAAVAGLVSWYISLQAPAIFVKFLGTPSTPVYQMKPDVTVLIYLGVVVVSAACIAGLAPAGESLRVNLAAVMKAGEGGSATGAKRRRGALIVAQVAMSLALLVMAGLFLRAQYGMLHSDPGFETRHVLYVPLPESGPALLLAELNSRLRAIPMVQSVAAGSPFSARELVTQPDEVRVPGQPPGTGKSAELSSVSSEYFETLGIPLQRGRTLVRPGEAVVSQAFAQMLLPGKDPLGEKVVLADGTADVIVGVARDISIERAGAVDDPHLYRLRDPHSAVASLVVRFQGDSRAAEASVREALKRLDPGGYVTPRTIQSLLDQLADAFASLVKMTLVVAGSALSLAALGIYGVIAFAVRRQTKEMGIRMALGATKAVIVRSVLKSGASSILAGLAVGMLLAVLIGIGLGRVMQKTPVAINIQDPLAFILAAVFLTAVGVCAMLGPAWRAAGSDPMRALRNE